MKETPRAAAAFDEYCMMGPGRSLYKLVAQLRQNTTKTPPTIDSLKVWSKEHQWQERVREYDSERAHEKQAKLDEEIARMNQEHALMGRTQALRAVKQIQTLIEAKSFGSQAAVQLLKIATDLERVARGASTEQIAFTGKDGGPLQHDVTDRVIFYMPQIDPEPGTEGGDANASNSPG